MRKLNMFLVIGILVTFILHGVGGALRLAGASAGTMTAAAWCCVGLITAHVIVTVILTVQTLQARRRSGAGYFRENKLFWARRISGLVILIPLIMHLTIFRTGSGAAFRLTVFTTGKLISQILLVLAIALHVLTNIKPALISFGVRDTKAFRVDLLFILSVILLLFGAAFVVYYLRWMAV